MMVLKLALLAAPAAATKNDPGSAVATKTLKLFGDKQVTTWCRQRFFGPWTEFYVSKELKAYQCRTQPYSHLCDQITQACKNEATADCKLSEGDGTTVKKGLFEVWKQVKCKNNKVDEAKEFVRKAARSIYSEAQIDELRRLHAERIRRLNKTDEPEALSFVKSLRSWNTIFLSEDEKKQLELLFQAIDPALQLSRPDRVVIKCNKRFGGLKCGSELLPNSHRKAEECEAALKHRFTGFPRSKASDICGEMKSGKNKKKKKRLRHEEG